MWENHCTLAGTLQRIDDVQQECVVTVFYRWYTETETAIQVIRRVEAVIGQIAKAYIRKVLAFRMPNISSMPSTVMFWSPMTEA